MMTQGAKDRIEKAHAALEELRAYAIAERWAVMAGSAGHVEYSDVIAKVDLAEAALAQIGTDTPVTVIIGAGVTFTPKGS